MIKKRAKKSSKRSMKLSPPDPCPCGVGRWETIDLTPDKVGAPPVSPFSLDPFAVDGGGTVTGTFNGKGSTKSPIDGKCTDLGGSAELAFETDINDVRFSFVGEVQAAAGGINLTIENGRYQVLESGASGGLARVNVPSDPGETGGWGGTNGP